MFHNREVKLRFVDKLPNTRTEVFGSRLESFASYEPT